MKKHIFFLLLIYITSSPLSAKQWHRVLIDENASILFPSKPTSSDENGQASFSCIDSKSIYVASVQDMNELQTLGFGSKDEVNEFYKGVINGTLKKYHGKLIQTNDFYIRGLKGVEIEFTFNHESGFTEQRFSRFLVVNDITIILQFSTSIDSAGSGSSIMRRKHFFDSLKLRGRDDDLGQYNDDKGRRITSKVAYVIGSWLPTLVIIIGLIIIIRFIIKRLN
jgi:hypothetical protein